MRDPLVFSEIPGATPEPAHFSAEQRERLIAVSRAARRQFAIMTSRGLVGHVANLYEDEARR